MARILIIDDSNVQRTYVKLVCEGEGHEVLEASDGGEGVELATSASPDVILLDLQMPDMSGQDVLRQLAEQDNTTPVIVLTADDPEAVESECLSLGATMAIKKPDDPNELLGLIGTVLSSQ